MVPRTLLLVPAIAGLSFLAGCDNHSGEAGGESFSSSSAYAGAHPPVPAPRFAVIPPPATPAYPQGSSGPGTPSVVPAGVQPDVVDFVGRELDRINQFIGRGRIDRATRALRGLDLQRSSWSRATQEALAPRIDAARKALDAAGRRTS